MPPRSCATPASTCSRPTRWPGPCTRTSSTPRRPALPGRCLARSLFLDPRSRTFYRYWPRLADNAVGGLRAEAARSRADRDLADLIEQLSERSEEFRTRWTGHVVDHYRSGDQHFRHELVGDLTLRYEALDVVADPGLTLLVYHAEPGSPSAAALARLTP